MNRPMHAKLGLVQDRLTFFYYNRVGKVKRFVRLEIRLLIQECNLVYKNSKGMYASFIEEQTLYFSLILILLERKKCIRWVWTIIERSNQVTSTKNAVGKLYLCDILTKAFIIHSIELNCTCIGNTFNSLHFKECIHII